MLEPQGDLPSGKDEKAEFLKGLIGGQAPTEFTFMDGTEKGSQYLVLAQAKGMKIGVRPLVAPGVEEGTKKPVLFLLVRIRIQLEDIANSFLFSEMEPTFGVPVLKGTDKGGHWSAMAGVPVLYLPCSRHEAYLEIKNQKLVEGLSKQLLDMVGKNGVKPTVTQEQLTDYLDQEYCQHVADKGPAGPKSTKLVWVK